MRRITLADIIPGMRLAMPIYNERGEVLLHSQIPLSDNYVALLRRKGCTVIWVHDRDTEDVRVIDILSERLRGRANIALADALNTGQTSLQDVRGKTVEERLRFLQSDEFKKGIAAFPIDAIEKVADSVAEEVLGASKLANLFSAIRLGDAYLHAHSLDSTVTALMIGRRLQFDRATLRRLATSCLLHDIGMMLIDPAILTKPGALADAEAAEMRQHTTLGFGLLETVHRDRLANQVALQHHERQDGFGYPRRLTGSNQLVTDALKRRSGDMMLWAEVVAVADVFDALTSDRPYRPAIPPEELPSLLRSLAGRQLNSELIGFLLEMVPLYPLGTEVVVTKGPVTGCRGVVVNVDPTQPERPVVRLLYDKAGERTRPAEVDLRKVRSVEVRSRAAVSRSSPSPS